MKDAELLEKSGNAKVRWMFLVSEILKGNIYKGLWHVARGKL